MTHTAPQHMGLAEWALLVMLSLLWGGAFFFSKLALNELPPFTLVLSRVAIAAAVLFAVLRVTGQYLTLPASTWRDLFVMGLLNNVAPFSLIFYGQTQIASALASILNASTPLFTVLLAHALTRDEKMSPGKVIGVLTGLAGVACIIGFDVLQGAGSAVLAQLACIGAAISYACAAIHGRRFRALPPLLTASGQLGCSTLVMLPLVLWVDRPWTLAPPGMTTLWALLGLALLSTALAYAIYFRLLARAGATNVLLVTLLIPVSALLLGTLILDERLDGRHFGGMALIGLGLAAIDGRLFQRR